MKAQERPRRCNLVVVKIGGSLAGSPRLADWVAAICAAPSPMVVVPGGGPFADQVRTLQSQWSFDDALAHRLAIAAMEIFGRIIVSLDARLAPADSQQAIRHRLAEGRAAVWMPTRMVVGNSAIPETWAVTSDSLAAWLAGELGAERLVLVKSAEPPTTPQSASALSARGLVDAAFPGFLAGSGCEAWCLGPGQSRSLAIDAPLPGTAILAQDRPR